MLVLKNRLPEKRIPETGRHHFLLVDFPQPLIAVPYEYRACGNESGRQRVRVGGYQRLDQMAVQSLVFFIRNRLLPVTFINADFQMLSKHRENRKIKPDCLFSEYFQEKAWPG